jgi:hypothetical protein
MLSDCSLKINLINYFSEKCCSCNNSLALLDVVWKEWSAVIRTSDIANQQAIAYLVYAAIIYPENILH